MSCVCCSAKWSVLISIEGSVLTKLKHGGLGFLLLSFHADSVFLNCGLLLVDAGLIEMPSSDAQYTAYELTLDRP